MNMEKFSQLAKFLHCHRQWRHGQISPLKNGSGMLLEKVGESETISHCTGSQGKLLRVLYNAPKVGWFWTPTSRYLPWETSSKRKVNQTYNVCKYFSERNKNRILWFCWGEKSKASIFDLGGDGSAQQFLASSVSVSWRSATSASAMVHHSAFPQSWMLVPNLKWSSVSLGSNFWFCENFFLTYLPLKLVLVMAMFSARILVLLLFVADSILEHRILDILRKS